MDEATIQLSDVNMLLQLFGAGDQHVRKLREEFGVSVTHRERTIQISGEQSAVIAAAEAIKQMRGIAESRGVLFPEDVDQVIAVVSGRHDEGPVEPIEVFSAGKRVSPRTPGQARYINAIRENDLVFATGPAGTGKTYLAVAMAVEAMQSEKMRKIVLVRPAVEAGERLGFLPGDLHAKINPYLRPLLDALHEMMDDEKVKRFIERDVIEVVPLAYMRGRTLNEAFIILDEGQNTSVPQMKMFLTRMGAGSKIVVSGDTTQTDLPPGVRSGLIDARSRLKGIKGIKWVRMTRADIVRHRLVQDIVDAYESDPRHAHPRGEHDAE